ncbi:MAG TPA: PEGA domain-containing protein, partial [Sandaracinaceae bacterium]
SLREQGRDDEALPLLRRAHELEPSAQTLAQVALAEQALGRFRDAERNLAAALEQGGPFIRRHRRALEEALETIRSHLGELELIGGVEGAEVRIDGELVGTLPLGPISVEAGVVVVEVSAPGYLPYQRRVEVAPRERARREVALVARPTAAASASEAAPGATAPVVVVRRAPDGGLLAASVVLLGLGAAGLAIFGGVGAAAQLEYDSLASGCGATMSCRDADVSTLRDLNLGADVALGAGIGALAVGSVVLAIALASGSEAAPSARLELGPRGALVRGAF